MITSYSKFKSLLHEAKRMNLPHNTTYHLINSYYTGGIMENPEQCENCGKPIANVGVVENENGDKYHVGMDCASTLSGINDDNKLSDAIDEFKSSVNIRTKIRKILKNSPHLHLVVSHVYHDDNIIMEINDGGRTLFREYVSSEFLNKFLPEYSKLISNSEKTGYYMKYNKDTDFGFDFSKIKSPRDGGNNFIFDFDGFKVEIKNDESISMNGTINKLIFVRIYKDGELVGENSTYMKNDVRNYLQLLLNKYNFEKYINN